MIYQIGNMALNCIREVFCGPANDVFICCDDNAPVETYYTVLRVKDHRIAKEIIENFEETGKKILATSTFMEQFLFVFPYKKERSLDAFYMGEAYDVATCEQICTNLIMECISCDLPYPFLFMILTQSQIHLEKDNSIYFSYQVDVSNFSKLRNERDCAVQCASIVLEMLKAKANKKAMSYELLSRKIPRESYQRFTDLYKDVKLASDAEGKKGILKRIKAWFFRNQDNLFRIFLVVCLFLGIVTILMLLTQLIFGDVPFLRIFYNSFKVIGTESMLQ